MGKSTTDKYIAAGLCYRCGVNAPTEGQKRCNPCREKDKISQKSYDRENRDKINQKRRNKRAADRQAVFDHYGNACACCGESEPQFLAIDHVENNGREHRKVVSKLATWLVTNNFPEGFQILCHNCNWSKHANGGECIHKTRVDKLLRTV